MSFASDPITVLGAGPAGATAARQLAIAGVRVRLLDRSTFPRNKPCGGGISFRAIRRFPYLESALHAIPTHAVSRLYLEGPGGESTVIESDSPAALMVRRVEFDQLLVSLAVRAGAELVAGVNIVDARADENGVTLTARDGRRFDAPIVIAADGVHSVVARRLGLTRGWPADCVALDMMEETPRPILREADPSTLWVAFGYGPTTRDADRGPAPEGYAYIFPKRDHVNVGIGYVLTHYRQAIDDSPYVLHRKFIEELRRRDTMQGESVRENFTPFLIPVGGPLRHPGRGRVLLAGDAGGFVNGFTAEGIYYAMVTGELTARAILQSKGSVESLADRYRQACDHEIGAELRDSILLRRYLFNDRRRIARAIAGARREPAITRRVLDFARGQCGYYALRRRLLARSPVLGMQLLWEHVKNSFAAWGARRYDRSPAVQG